MKYFPYQKGKIKFYVWFYWDVILLLLINILPNIYDYINIII